MGADQFESHSALPTLRDAFAEAQQQAAWEHGHGGYTGTMAEKHDCRSFTLPEGKTSSDVIDALEDWTGAPKPTWLPHGIEEAYNDKWGPAVAVRSDDGGWDFFGYASS